jgi:hypothetical protein
MTCMRNKTSIWRIFPNSYEDNYHILLTGLCRLKDNIIIDTDI